jgi:hypothetical protein
MWIGNREETPVIQVLMGLKIGNITGWYEQITGIEAFLIQEL